MEEIVNSVKRVTDIMAEISSASAEQSAGIEQVNAAIGRMDEATRQNATLVEQAAPRRPRCRTRRRPWPMWSVSSKWNSKRAMPVASAPQSAASRIVVLGKFACSLHPRKNISAREDILGSRIALKHFIEPGSLPCSNLCCPSRCLPAQPPRPPN
jgi:hypothetical protein